MKFNICSPIILTALILLTSCGNPHNAHAEDKVSLYNISEHRIELLTQTEFITGCIFGMISPSANDETLKAAAVCLNTLLQYKEISENGVFPADIIDGDEITYMSPNEAKEKYGSSYSVYLKKVSEATEYGCSRVITYNGAPICPAMCQISTGLTDSGEMPYLRGVKLPSDRKNEDYLSTAAFSEDMIRTVLSDELGIKSVPADCNTWFSSPKYAESGTLLNVDFCGRSVTGQQLMELFGLRSAAVTIEFAEGRFVFSCRGWGNNLGMSLAAAKIMADKGSTAEEIISFFYAGTEIQSLT